MPLLGCATTTSLPQTTPAAQAGPVTSSTPPTDLEATWTTRCTTQVGYWVERLQDDPEHSYDYQEMGLSSVTYEVLEEVRRAAGDRPRDTRWVQRRAATACADHAHDAVTNSSSRPGWP